MKVSVAGHLKGRPKVYRLGLMGLSGAGKSCILAALGMLRERNPKGYTATRLRDLPGVVDDGKTRRGASDPVRAFYNGARWLAEAEATLAEGRPVKATETGARLLALYNFTLPGRGAVWVELVDYSGELLTLTNDALTVNLRRHLERLDGLLILAQAPAVGEEAGRLPEELHRLQMALKTLSGKVKDGAKWGVPVALLFNKWDRRGVPKSDEEGHQAVGRLLAASPAHRSLYDDLKNTVIGDGSRAFPVSAFGPSERYKPADGPAYERPIHSSPLRSFGLEDPFAWVVEQRDKIDWKRFGSAGSKVRVPHFWQVRQTHRALAQGIDLTRRYSPEQPEQHKGAEAATGKVRRAFRWQAGACALLAVLLLFSGLSAIETWHDHASYSRVQTSLDASVPDSGRLEESAAWLTDYADSGWHRHLASSLLVLSCNDARKKLAECQDRSVDWNARVRGNRDDMAGLEADLEVVLAGVRIERLDTVIAQLKTLPRFPEADDTDLGKRRDAARAKLAGHQLKLQQMRANKEDKRLLDEYDGLMKAQKVADAARLATGAGDAVGDKIRSDFRAACLPTLKEVQRRRRNASENAALVAELKEAYESRHVAELLRGEQAKIAGLLDTARREWDRDLYDAYRKTRREKDGDAYARDAPLKRMKDAVERYLKFQADKSGHREFTLSVAEIYWAEWWDDYQNSVEVNFRGAQVIDEEVTSKKKGRSSSVGSHAFKAKETDTIEVTVRVTNTKANRATRLLYDQPGGSATFSGTVAELRSATRSLTNAPKACGATVTVTVVGSLVEPPLPDWSE